jgi:hypothetical protein
LLSGDADYQRFMELYYGKTLLFADKEVFDKLNDFHRLLYGMMHKTTEFDKFGIKAVGGKAVMACHRSVRRKFPKLGPELGTETMENIWAIPDDDEKDGNEPVKIGELPFEKISIPELLKNPAQYDKKKVAFSGIVRTWTQVHKDGVYSVHIAVEGGGKTIDLHSASNEGVYVTKGTRVEVKGIFYRELERGALKATNTVDASPAYGGGIVKAK